MQVSEFVFYNMLSVLVIFLGSLFGTKKEQEANYFSYVYLAFFTLIFINGVVLGTWSFSVESEPVPLPGRLLRTFDLAHRAGLWEMIGQLLIACSAAHIATILTSGKNTVTRKIRDIRLSVSERTVFAAGIILMLVGAVVESIAIGGKAICKGDVPSDGERHGSIKPGNVSLRNPAFPQCGFTGVCCMGSN